MTRIAVVFEDQPLSRFCTHVLSRRSYSANSFRPTRPRCPIC
jgi:hypothetical protein